MDAFRYRSCLRWSGMGLVLGLFVAVSGCGNTEPAVTEADADLMDELLGVEPKSQREPAEPVDSEDSEGDSTRPVSQSHATARPRSFDAPGNRLELRLQEGDRFPLVKTVDQTLLQKSESAPAMAHTRLELTLAITVEQVRADAILLGIRYSRVSYQHDVNGQRISFDSGNHQGAVPWDVIPYAGMIGNGFSFWLGRDNRIRELVGYQEFLERCVAEVPLERRQTLLSEISNRFGDDGVANFVDDSVGLLPYDTSVDADSATRVMPGDVWTRERRLMQPVPVYLTSTYRLTSMDEKTAEIDIMGKVASGEASTPNNDGRLRITGGHSLGRCIVDRATGLPLEMNLTRFITMKITTSDQQEVVQEKQITTTVRAFPEVRGSVVGATRQAPIQKTSGSGLNADSASQIPTSTNPSPGVQAVYPD